MDHVGHLGHVGHASSPLGEVFQYIQLHRRHDLAPPLAGSYWIIPPTIANIGHLAIIVAALYASS